jgi:single-strand DNA-binding protein
MQSSVTLTGNVVNDVVLRHTSGGPVANFRMACDSNYLDRRTGRWVDRSIYLQVSAWRGLGENVATSVVRGQPVVVVGRLKQREYDREGNKVTVIEVEADHVGHDLKYGAGRFARAPKGPQTADLAREVEPAGAAAMSGVPTDVTDSSGWGVPGLAAVADPGMVPGDSTAA